MLNDKAYKVIKWVVMLLLPAASVLYKTVADAVGLPNTDTVVTIINAVTLFLGTITGISSYNYNKTKE